MKKTHIILHHSLVSRYKNDDQFDAINRNHISRGWGMIGYQYTINPAGIVKKGRHEGQRGAHCYQQNMNELSIGIMLEGNFDVENPTKEQIESLKILLKDIMKRHNIEKENVMFHRDYATYKSCPGNKITKGLLKDILDDKKDLVSPWAKEAVEWCIEKKIATQWAAPQAPITKEEMAVMIYRMYNLNK
jgi:hypothetical protein